MRKIRWAFLCFLCATLARAQSPKDMAKMLESSLANQQLVLKNFSGQDTVRASWSGTGLTLEQPQWREFGILKVDAVSLEGQNLKLQCTRRGVVRDATGRTALYGQPTKVNIDIDMQGANPDEALPKVRDALFFPSVEDARAAIPKPMQANIPFDIDAPWPPKKHEAVKLCDCASSDKAPCETSTSKNAQVRPPPKFLHGANPHFSDDARRAKLNGAVIVQFVVDKDGDTRDVWVARPLGLGLDEEAAKAVLTYTFQPSTCQGNPVNVYLVATVNFQIY